MGRLGTTAVATVLLVACAPTNQLQGNWIVDVDATTRSAVAAGIPESFSRPRIRATYEGGLMRIDKDKLTLGLDSATEVMARNYTVLGAEGNCTRLRIAQSNLEYRMCLEGDRLTFHDPKAVLEIVYTRQ